ncbi:hypothetical protein [Pseudomonas sp. BF-R-26]|jgi:hypothetical protein|uniref:hypothetical protein n=1 Tax=Pseudomonas sp. BF-R-26 TaxID=2832398 RepID=UPI001CC0F1AB|nr:hypothetical protein [Pseudomonas sp. BF-R-26]
MPAFMLSSGYIGTQTDYTQISHYFAGLTWSPEILTVYITNGWHTGFESRYRQTASGGLETYLAEVTYCGYRINSDSAPKNHFYIN